MAAVATTLGVTATIATAWVKHLVELTLCPVAVPRYVFWPWLFLTAAVIFLALRAIITAPPKTALNFYRRDIVDGFLWRWDVTARQMNGTPYGMVHDLTRYCRNCQSTRITADLHGQGMSEMRITCLKCHLETIVSDFRALDALVKEEIERRAVTEEWRGAEKRIKRAKKAAERQAVQQSAVDK